MSERQPTSLIIGSDSRIGSALSAYLQATGEQVLETSRRPGTSRLFLDLSQDLYDWQPPENIDTVYFCAGVTLLADCEHAPDESRLINVNNTLLVARKLAARGAFVVFPSSNLVFDGTKPFRREDEPLSPHNEYGRQKAEAEHGLGELGAQVAIVRLTKVVWAGFPRFMQWSDALCRGERITPLSDVLFSPAPLSLVVRTVREIGASASAGIWHMSGAQDVSYAAAAYYVAEQIQADKTLIKTTTSAEAGFSTDFNPGYTTLDTHKLNEAFGITAPDPWETLNTCIEFGNGKDQHHHHHAESTVSA